MIGKRLAILLIITGLLIMFRDALVIHTKTLLLVAEELLQAPVKPLAVLTTPPEHRELPLDSPHGRINADLFLPTQRFGSPEANSRPAVIIAMGIRTTDQTRPEVLGFARTLGRLGFVVLWPRLAALDAGTPALEEPATLLAGFRYLEQVEVVDKERISLVGFSVGSSIALVAAADPLIAERLHTLVFFGGYYDILDYLVSIASRSILVDGEARPWDPAQETVELTRDILETHGLHGLRRVMDATTREEASALLRAVPEEELLAINRYNPSHAVDGLKSRIFILHDRKDNYIPYVESLALNAALNETAPKTFLLTDLLEHVMPGGGLSWDALGDGINLYRFLYQAMYDLSAPSAA
ncbi:MAG: hypothetical protein HY689_00790 [Chloroflexi bacterium]|nr:hypothetical protein [Chloroflexota bacterium]